MPGKKPLFYLFDYLLKTPTNCPTATGAALYLISNAEQTMDGCNIHTVYQGGDFVRVVLRRENNTTITFDITEDKFTFFEPYAKAPSVILSATDVRYTSGTDPNIISLMERVCQNFFPTW